MLLFSGIYDVSKIFHIYFTHIDEKLYIRDSAIYKLSIYTGFIIRKVCKNFRRRITQNSLQINDKRQAIV